jgi:Rieske Fe-S protein
LKNCDEIGGCSGRREFIVKTAFTAGGLLLALSRAAFGATVEDLVIRIDEHSPLNKVGGTLVVDATPGRVIILRTAEKSFVAYSAICTHKRGSIEYDDVRKLFVCPKHGSTFDPSTGAAVDGPADDPLPSFKAAGNETSVTITLGS